MYLPSLYPGTFKVVGDATNPDNYFQLAGTYYQLDTISLSLDTEGECSTLTDPARDGRCHEGRYLLWSPPRSLQKQYDIQHHQHKNQR